MLKITNLILKKLIISINGLLFLLCLIFIFSCKEKLKEGEYYETIIIGDN